MPSSAVPVVAGRVRQPGRRLARPARRARGRCSTTPASRSSSTTTPATPASATCGWSTAARPATVTLVAGLLDELGVTIDRAAGHLPLRRAGRRHRLLPLRQHPARHPRARRPAAGHRHRPLRDQPPAVRHRAVRLARPAVGRHRPRRARARGRRRPGLDLVEHRRGRRVRPARRAARGAGRRRPLRRRRPTSPACSRVRTTAPGRCRCARAAAPTSPGSRWRSAAAGTRWPPATAPTSTARRPSRPCAASCPPRSWSLTRPVESADRRRSSRSPLPALVVLAAEPLYLLVDTAVVGHLGHRRRSAGSPSAAGCSPGPAALLNFLAYGTTARAARRAGAGDRAGRRRRGRAGHLAGARPRARRPRCSSSSSPGR